MNPLDDLFAGTGATGQPLGAAHTQGTGTETGAALAHAGVLSMKRKCADADAGDESISFLAAPATRELLEAREVIADAGEFIWQDDRVADRPAAVSTDVPAASCDTMFPTPAAFCVASGVS